MSSRDRRAAHADRLHVDWTRCAGRGLCHELLPEILVADDWGYPLPRGADSDPVVTPALRPHAEQAVDQCPRLALRIVPGNAPSNLPIRHTSPARGA